MVSRTSRGTLTFNYSKKNTYLFRPKSEKLCALFGVVNNVYTSHTAGKNKGKVYPITVHEGSKGEERYTSTLSLASALDSVWSTPRLGRFTPRKDRVPIV